MDKMKRCSIKHAPLGKPAQLLATHKDSTQIRRKSHASHRTNNVSEHLDHRPDREGAHYLFHMRNLEILVRLLVLPRKDGEDLDGRVQAETLSTLPAPEPSHTNTRLRGVTIISIRVSVGNAACDLPRSASSRQNIVESSRWSSHPLGEPAAISASSRLPSSTCRSEHP